MINETEPSSLKGVLRGSAAALCIKFTASILGFAMFALASREMGPAAFGSLAMIFNAVSFLAVFALCGQETLIVRSWSEYCSSSRVALARGALVFGLLVVLAAALATTFVVALVWKLWDPSLPVSLLVAACSFLLMQSLLHFSGQFARVAAGIVIGDAPRESMWRLIVVVVLAVHMIAGVGFGAPEFFFVSTLAMAAAIAFQVWQTVPFIPKAIRRAASEHDIRGWLRPSFNMWLAAMLDTIGQYLEVVVIGLFLGPTAAAFYFVATRITNGFAMISASISGYATSRISGLFYSGAREDLQEMLRRLAGIGLALVGIGIVTVLLGGKLLLSAFGDTYVSAYPALIVLASGAATAALAGPAAQLLLLTGHEGTYPRIMGCGMVLRFVLIAILGPTFGLMGAAVAWAISAAAIGVALVGVTRHLIGVDPSPRSLFARMSAPVGWLRGDVL